MEEKFVFVTEEGNEIQFNVLCKQEINGIVYVVLSNNSNDYVCINKIINDELIEIEDENELTTVISQIKSKHPELALEL